MCWEKKSKKETIYLTFEILVMFLLTGEFDTWTEQLELKLFEMKYFKFESINSLSKWKLLYYICTDIITLHPPLLSPPLSMQWTIMLCCCYVRREILLFYRCNSLDLKVFPLWVRTTLCHLSTRWGNHQKKTSMSII